MTTGGLCLFGKPGTERGGGKMTTLTVQSVVTTEGLLKIEVPCRLPPGPVEVVLVLGPPPATGEPAWDRLYGLGKEVWQGVDPKQYVEDLRQDRGGIP
jgi:hypothetical protein